MFESQDAGSIVSARDTACMCHHKACKEDPVTLRHLQGRVTAAAAYSKNIHCVPKKSDAKIEITITTSNLIRINHPLSNFNYHLSGANIANFNRIHCTVSEQQLFKKWNSKTEVSIWKSRLSSSYTLTSVTVCALDTFSAAAVRKQDA